MLLQTIHNQKGENIMFSHLIIELAKIGYIRIIGSIVELSVDGRLLVMEDFYDSLYSLLESLDFSTEPFFSDNLEGDCFKVESNENNFTLNVIYC